MSWSLTEVKGLNARYYDISEIFGKQVTRIDRLISCGVLSQ